MKTREALTVLAKHRGDAIVVCALGMAANEWWAVTRSEDSFYNHRPRPGFCSLVSTRFLREDSVRCRSKSRTGPWTRL